MLLSFSCNHSIPVGNCLAFLTLFPASLAAVLGIAWVFLLWFLMKTRCVSVGFPSEQDFTWMKKWMFDVKAFIDSQRHGPYKFPYSTLFCLFCIVKTISKRWNFKYFINCWEFYLLPVIIFKTSQSSASFPWVLNSFYYYYCLLWKGQFFHLGEEI